MNPEIEARAAQLRDERVPFVHARVVRAERPTSAKPGDQAVVLPDGSIEGFVGGACAESTVRAQSLSLLDSGKPLLLRISPEAPAGGTGEAGGVDSEADDPPGTLSVVNHCLSGGTLEIFLEPVVPAPVVAVHGDSPIAAALLSLADGVGFRGARGADVSLAGGSDGPAAVVVATHGRDEEQIIEAALRAGVPYVGLVASRKRGEAVLAALDLDPAQLGAVHTPAGLDIGARTPHEVALSILAEIISLRPEASGAVAAPAEPADPVTAPPGRRDALATDPVCGMAVVADEQSLHLDHDGRRHWFCGSGCLRAFAADPGAYPSPAG